MMIVRSERAAHLFLYAVALALILFVVVQKARSAVVACPEGAVVRLHVFVQDVRNARGNVTVTLYGSRPEDFLASGRKASRVRIPAIAGVTEACLAASEAGTYAIAVYHDEDNDHDFDRTWIGLPAEGYGFSNDAPTIIGPPSFDDVKFQAHDGDNELRLRMRY